MKIFISYAHVDKYRVLEVVNILRNAKHDPWFDHDLMVGQRWDQQLITAIETCDCFLYALTPESADSKWCQWEFAQAVHKEKPIIPVLLQKKTNMGVLSRVQYADFSEGPTADNATKLITGIPDAQCIPIDWVPMPAIPHDDPKPKVEKPAAPPDEDEAETFYQEGLAAFKEKDFRMAQDLLLICLDFKPDHAKAKALLTRVELRLEQQLAAQSVRTTIQPVASPPTPARPDLPDSVDLMPAPFAWENITAGHVTLITEEGWINNYIPKRDSWGFDVPVFTIAKYPVTNAQFAKFMDAGGYAQEPWWTEDGWQRRTKEGWTKPRYWGENDFVGAEKPVVGVSWYEAIAFCRWLSQETGEKIMLPAEAEWQRAAQGDDGREYPWGDKWDSERCNNSRTIQKTTPVMQYASIGYSPFGIVDMAGNVWEWCVTDYANGSNDPNRQASSCVLRGGSWYDSGGDWFRTSFRHFRNAHLRYDDAGFRIARYS